MFHGFRVLSFLAGVATGAALGNTPAVRDAAKQLLRKALKAGLIAQREFQSVAEQLREDWEDTLAEVKAEMDEDDGAPAAHAHHEGTRQTEKP